MKALRLRTFRYGETPRKKEGLRIGTTRRPPRGVPREKWQTEDYFDVWFPILAPSAGLLRRAKKQDMEEKEFFQKYEKEILGKAESRQAIELLANLALRIPISVGCFCKEEASCHRLRLSKLIERTAKQQKNAR